MKELVESTKREYRISLIHFANQGDPYQRKVGSVANQAYVNNMAFASPTGGGHAVSDNDTISNAQKVSLAADVVFRVSVYDN